MKQVSVDLSAKEAEQLAEQLVSRLAVPAKLRLAVRLDRETRRARWTSLVKILRRRFAQRPLSALEIRRLCETVRQERFERRQRAARRR